MMYGRISLNGNADAVSNRFAVSDYSDRFEVRMHVPRKLLVLLDTAHEQHVRILSFNSVQEAFKINGGTLDTKRLDEFMNYRGWFRDDVMTAWVYRGK